MSAVRAVAAPAPRTLSSSDKALVEAMSAALGGLISTVVFYPLDTAKTRVQARTPSTDLSSLCHLPSLLGISRRFPPVGRIIDTERESMAGYVQVAGS